MMKKAKNCKKSLHFSKSCHIIHKLLGVVPEIDKGLEMMKVNKQAKVFQNIVFAIGVGIFAVAHVDVAVAMNADKKRKVFSSSSRLNKSMSRLVENNAMEKNSLSLNKLPSRRNSTQINSSKRNNSSTQSDPPCNISADRKLNPAKSKLIKEDIPKKKSNKLMKKLSCNLTESNVSQFLSADEPMKQSGSEFTPQKQSEESISSEDSLQSNLTEIVSSNSESILEEVVPKFKKDALKEFPPITDKSEEQSETNLSNNITPKKTDKSCKKKSPSKAVSKENEEDAPISSLEKSLRSVIEALSDYRKTEVTPKPSPQKGQFNPNTTRNLLEERIIQQHINSVKESIDLIDKFSNKYQNCSSVTIAKEEIEEDIGIIKMGIIQESKKLAEDLKGKEGVEKLENAIMTLDTCPLQVENMKLKIENNLLRKNVEDLESIKLAEELASSEEAQEKKTLEESEKIQLTRDDVLKIVQEAREEDKSTIEQLQEELKQVKEGREKDESTIEQLQQELNQFKDVREKDESAIKQLSENINKIENKVSVFDDFIQDRQKQIAQSVLAVGAPTDTDEDINRSSYNRDNMSALDLSDVKYCDTSTCSTSSTIYDGFVTRQALKAEREVIVSTMCEVINSKVKNPLQDNINELIENYNNIKNESRKEIKGLKTRISDLEKGKNK